jgi:hypothetical protein
MASFLEVIPPDFYMNIFLEFITQILFGEYI